MSFLARRLRYKIASPFIQTRLASLVSYDIYLQRRPKQSYSTAPIDKYQEKLLKKAKEQGFDSVGEFLESAKADIDKKKKDFNRIDPLKELEDYEQRMKMSANNAGMTSARGPIDASQAKVPFKTLDSFLNVEKIKELSKQEVEFLWRAKWMSKDDALCAVVPVNIFDRMMTNAKSNPIFVLPLPRAAADGKEAPDQTQSVELHYIQWQFVGPNTVHCIMTSLAEFKLHNEYAKPHTTFQFHLEMAKEKKIVLMNGQVEPDINVSLQDAQLLLLNVQRFWGAMGEETPIAKQRLKLLRDFTRGSTDFNVDLLISLSQSMEN
ncbi:hypothetical protein HG536_0E02490 [Torulaspora globosa]|uniref:Uncharacterized protein n=1 Tax=Torulaspora globosa TaxID=48254 RepID=A0A7G3ZIK2_9SACH|nr:uncharacterized protein HG536_0E02490 [Torulaspora globosa]QLL33338.1 hypothetical protein HG536_0E02490 [Torulaspora globosa]